MPNASQWIFIGVLMGLAQGCGEPRVVSRYKAPPTTKPEITVEVPQFRVGDSSVAPLELPFGKRFAIRGKVTGMSQLKQRLAHVYMELRPLDGANRIHGATRARVEYVDNDVMSFSGEMGPLGGRGNMRLKISIDKDKPTTVIVTVR